MRWLAPLLLWALYAAQSWALQQSEAGVVDWHKPLVGVPLTHWTTTAPVFHRIGEQNEATQSIVLTATGSNVLTALNPVNGSLAWRYHFGGPRDQVLAFRKHKNVVASLSGPGGATLRLFDVLKGHLLIEKHLHAPELGRLMESNVGAALAFLPGTKAADVLILTNGHEVRRVDGETGELKWGWISPDQTSKVIYSDIIPTDSAIYVIGLAKSLASYTLHITTLSPSTGAVVADADIPSSISHGSHFLHVYNTTSPAPGPLLVWLETESSKAKTLELTPALAKNPFALKGAYDDLVDVGLAAQGQFVAIKGDGAGRVFKLDKGGAAIKAVWDFQESARSDRYAPSMYAGGLDMDGRPYVARVFWSHANKLANAHVYAHHLGDGKGQVNGFTFPFNTNLHGIIQHVAVDAVNPSEAKVLVRMFITTSTGAVQLWQQDRAPWTREEGLAYISAAELVDLPEPAVVHSRVGDAPENYFERLLRHAADLQNLPHYVRGFVTRFATGSYASVSVAGAAGAKGELARDAFGLRKIIVAATPYGKVYGLDSRNGEILWSRVLGLGWAAEVGGKIFPAKLFVTRTVEDGEGNPQVVLVTQRRADNTLVDTVLFHLDALTGEDVLPDTKRGPILEGLDAIAGPSVEAFLLPTKKDKIVVMFDEYQQVFLYPDTKRTQDAFSKAAPSLNFVLRTGTPGQRKLMGQHVMSKIDNLGRFMYFGAWTFSLPASEEVRAIASTPVAPVASLGKVLGNRTTLYKYLNPHLTALVTVARPQAPGQAPACAVYLVDGVKGSVLYHARLPPGTPDGGEPCDVKIALSENWFVYHYYDGRTDGADATKGHRIVSVELYEGAGVDKKVKSSDLTSYSPDALDLSVYEQSYIFPHDITTLAISSTKFGITSKELIVASRNGQIQTFPRRFFDPRRPNRKPTAEEQEEMLIPYDPLIPDDPKRILSHKYDLAETKKILTSPALLESTAVVFTYGLDLFCSRVSPSGTFDVLSESFNKAQLVLTISGLVLAIVFTKPMVRRKKLRERWYQ